MPLSLRASRANNEYLFRKLIPMTHDEYMDEPGDVIEWTLRIDQLYKAEEARHNS